MMNKRKTPRVGLFKYALLLPVTLGLVLVANRETLAGMASVVSVSEGKVGEKMMV